LQQGRSSSQKPRRFKIRSRILSTPFCFRRSLLFGRLQHSVRHNPWDPRAPEALAGVPRLAGRPDRDARRQVKRRGAHSPPPLDPPTTPHGCPSPTTRWPLSVQSSHPILRNPRTTDPSAVGRRLRTGRIPFRNAVFHSICHCMYRYFVKHRGIILPREST